MGARAGIAAVLLVAGCAGQPSAVATPHPTPKPPPGVASENGVTIEEAAAVHDIRYMSGDRTVVAYLVLPATQKARAGVLFFHWLSEQGGNRNEFKAEAVALAEQGIASLLIQGDFPWSTQPSGAEHDIAAIRAQVASAKAGADLLLQQPGVDGHHLAFVGHDYGAMHGSVLLAEDSRFAGAVLMAPDANWVDWFSAYWSFLKTPADQASYAAALKPLDPVTMLPSVHCKVLLQFAQSDVFVSTDRAHAVEAAVPSGLGTTKWYDTDHGFNASAKTDRDAWLVALLTG